MSQAVVFMNDYPMELARAGWLAGEYPGHHLWGAEHLRAAGFNVIYAKHRGTRLDRWFRRSGYPLGDVIDEMQVARAWRGSPIAFSAYSSGLVGLARLRRAGLWPWPLVSVVHPGLPRRAELGALSAYDVVITISEKLRQELITQHGRTASNTVCLPWGPDLRFPGYRDARDDGYVISSGKSARDLPTLVAALAGTKLRAKIRTGSQMAPPPEVEPLEDQLFADFVPEIANASVVCIPLHRASAGYGLTELNDALALGKPVVVTRNDYLEPDVAQVGCGFTVEPGDVAGMREALCTLMGDASLRERFGTAGRRYAEQHHNADTFGAGLDRVVRSLARDVVR
jgi:glycosyltransferase involved in cell wall biosynthesis